MPDRFLFVLDVKWCVEVSAADGGTAVRRHIPGGREPGLRGRGPPGPPGTGGTCGFGRAGLRSQGGGRPGSGLAVEPACGVQAGHAGGRAVPRVPSRARGTGGCAAGVGLHLLVEGVADLPLECAQRLL
jgi:hypothetical protein